MNVVGPEFLVPLLHKNVSTIKVDARRKPQSLPPRLAIPGSAKLLWLESDVMEWLQSCRTAPKKRGRGNNTTPAYQQAQTAPGGSNGAAI